MRLPSIVAVVCLLMVPGALTAQFRQRGPGGAAANAGWAPVAVGVRIGFDNAQSRPMLGAMARIPVLPNGSVELMPNGDVTFLPGIKEYQGNLELVYVLGGRTGGFYGGGGIGLRNSVFGPDPSADRQSELTYSLVFGIRFGAMGRFRPELETRYIFSDELVRDPRLVSFGVTVALW